MPWLPWGSSSSSQPPPPKPQTTQERVDQYTKRLQSQIESLQEQDPQAILTSFNAQLAQLPPYLLLALGAALGLGTRRAYVRYLKRLPNGEWVTPDITQSKRWIKGYVTSVGDADNFRLYHTPGIGWLSRAIPTKRKDLTDQTLHIRIAGVDAPELGFFGKPTQPFAQDSLRWLKEQIEGKTLYCQLLQRDQYKRIVAAPYFKPRILPGWLVKGKSVGLEMVRHGWAAAYKEGGAVYGTEGEEEYFRLEKEAQDARRGMWEHGIQELPSEYKRRYREGLAGEVSQVLDEEQAADEGSSVGRRGWLSRIFGR
ncbi:nuclease [Dichomitus squalens]|uniref:Nuclease n=2 Tax=Dichomitus squalens TaxID=114155 RepID=A0A4Q9PN55_9APHY|nr:nuclease [Dichomitus squalens LYAD-421 SS1]EJF60231.1 nuclease [Dichomitus squalens LYAD-421 SS1]TBU41106.1 nuclease [Dichomitus squalens]TBU55701.1 nuclease [Dichomitus squalens]